MASIRTLARATKGVDNNRRLRWLGIENCQSFQVETGIAFHQDRPVLIGKAGFMGDLQGHFWLHGGLGGCGQIRVER